MGADYKGAEQEGCGCLDLRPDLLGGGSVGHVVCVGEVGYYPRIVRMLDRFHH